jgi:hypothetical protein
VPGPALTAAGLRPVVADFVTLAAPSDGVAVSHTAAVVAAPVAPDANAVAGARDAEAAVGVLHSDSLDAVAGLAAAAPAAAIAGTTGYNSTASSITLICL